MPGDLLECPLVVRCNRDHKPAERLRKQIVIRTHHGGYSEIHTEPACDCHLCKGSPETPVTNRVSGGYEFTGNGFSQPIVACNHQCSIQRRDGIANTPDMGKIL